MAPIAEPRHNGWMGIHAFKERIEFDPWSNKDQPEIVDSGPEFPVTESSGRINLKPFEPVFCPYG
jgi:hypothetical protein